MDNNNREEKEKYAKTLREYYAISNILIKKKEELKKINDDNTKLKGEIQKIGNNVENKKKDYDEKKASKISGDNDGNIVFILIIIEDTLEKLYEIKYKMKAAKERINEINVISEKINDNINKNIKLDDDLIGKLDNFGEYPFKYAMKDMGELFDDIMIVGNNPVTIVEGYDIKNKGRFLY